MTPTVRRLMPADIRARKAGVPIVSLTAYTAPMARLLDPAVDILLIGDSLGMVLYGFDSTLPVTLDLMIAHTSAVMRGSQRACVITDMPWGTYQESPEVAYRNCAQVMAKTGCQGVKIEGGVEMADTIRFLTSRGVPVMGHIGLLPQSVNALGGYRVQGRGKSEQARVVAEAGAFAMVIEGTAEPAARAATAAVAVPTIGIGASPACDGQVLVVDDVLGMIPEMKPRFVKRYAELAPVIAAAAASYADEVRTLKFPGLEHCYAAKAKKKRR